jgi:phosphoribosylaminoimidazolecarboxamide formyltransferase / IMP cyclohydrolase
MGAEQRHTGIERAEPGAARVRRALISVSEKAGVVELAEGLVELGAEIVSTGGTARALADAGVAVRAIEDFTGFPEMMDGRVKTLHPRLYAGLLAVRSEESHLRAAAEHEIEPVDLVCVNLYPFEQTVARGAPAAEVVENIDIGGPTMIRAAAKNHAYAIVLVDPADYAPVLAELREAGGRLSMATRERLAGTAFAVTARYDASISSWFAQREHEDFPAQRTLAYEKAAELRYGENPHQRAAYYAEVGAPTHLLAGVAQLHGKELSFNNLLDLSAARELVEDFSEPACAIVKHNNPCGCALGRTAKDAYERAFACDPLSAYGGVIALNRPVDLACAQAVSQQFVEVLLAPRFEPEALEILTAKKNVRLLELGDRSAQLATADGGAAGGPQGASALGALEAKPVIGGLLVQDRDRVSETAEQMTVMSSKQPSDAEWQDMRFAWQVCRHVRSNAIVIARDGATIGIGAGQMSRVDAVRIAIEKARAGQGGAGDAGAPAPGGSDRGGVDRLAGASLASDAFFPFADGPQLAIEAGVTAIVQPGGSLRDEEVVAAIDAAGVAMVATGVRHFRH